MLIEPDAFSGQVPWQQFDDAVDGMIGDALDDATQVILGVEPVDLGGLGEAVDGSGTLASGVGTGKGPVAAPKSDRTDRALGGQVVDAGAAVAQN